jgi:uncharacterized membrane protein
MNEPERSELERLKQRQAHIEREVSLLSTQLQALAARLEAPATEPEKKTALSTQAAASKSMPAEVSRLSQAPPPQSKSEAAITPSSVPPIIPTAKDPARIGAASATSIALKRETAQSARIPIPAEPGKVEARSQGSFELRLGTHWAPRVGIVMVLTALVFFGSYAYQNFVYKLGPGGKVALLYLASGVLLGAGAWWQRKVAKPSLKNYAQVLFAGGLAALYFTTYAAHHFEHLRVIESPLADGAMLLACAGVTVWIADRKKSEVMAIFAIGLAYYSSIITRVGLFTLYSNLVLTGAAVYFLVRNRWAMLSMASLVATYAAYGFWRFFDGSAWHWASPAEGLWTGTWFLICYWLLFSAAVFLSRHEKFAGENRAGFLTLNNGAFFALFLLTMLQVREGGFWKFALVYGSALLGLAALAHRLLASETATRNSYLSQGLLLVTLGVIFKFTGLELALILAAESIILLTFGQRRDHVILLLGAYVTAALATVWGVDGLRQFDPQGVWLGTSLGGLIMVNANLAHRHTLSNSGGFLRPRPTYFAGLALLIWLVTTWDNTTSAQFPLVLSAEALLLTASVYIFRARELPVLAQGYLVLAQAGWAFNALMNAQSLPWWNPLLLIGMTLVLSHWWQTKKVLSAPVQVGLFWQAFYGLAIIGVLYLWLHPRFTTGSWLVVTSGLAIALTAYGVVTRAWFVAMSGQIFLVVSTVIWISLLAEGKPAWQLTLAPILTFGLLSFSTVTWFVFKRKTESRARQPLLQAALAYRWTALAMSLWWICEYIPPRERTWVLALLGLIVFLGAGWKRNVEALLFATVFTATGMFLFWAPFHSDSTVYWPNLMAICVLLGQQRIAKALPERYRLEPPVHGAVIIAGGLSLWLFVSRWVMENAQGFYITATWSGLALVLFTCGILFRERVYRWLGLGILSCALGRAMIFDVWKLEVLYRILSFMALGVVLLVLGFIYSKYQEKIKEWL